MCSTVIMAMIMSAAAILAMIVFMLMGISQGSVKLRFDRNRHVARAVLVLHQKTHNFGSQTQIIDSAEIVTP